MIKAIFHKNSRKQVMGYKILGHAGAAPKGKDLVCSAVSVLQQHTHMGLTQLTKGQVFTVAECEGYAELSHMKPDRLTEVKVAQCQALLKTFLVSMKRLAADYPTYISFEVIEHETPLLM